MDRAAIQDDQLPGDKKKQERKETKMRGEMRRSVAIEKENEKRKRGGDDQGWRANKTEKRVEKKKRSKGLGREGKNEQVYGGVGR